MPTVKKLISFEESVANELEIVSRALGKSQKEVVESALDFYFDYTDGIIADKITDDIKAGKMSVYDESEIYENFGVDVESLED